MCIHSRSSNRQTVNTSLAVLGGSSLLEELLPFIGGLPCTKVQTFYRIELRGEVFYSSMFIRAKKRNSYIWKGAAKNLERLRSSFVLTEMFLRY